MSGLNEWFAMNGDGVFVWPCYVVTFLVLIGNLAVARRGRQRLVEDISLQLQSRGSNDTA